MKNTKQKIAALALPFSLVLGSPGLAIAQEATQSAPAVDATFEASAEAVSKGPALWVAKDEDTTIYLFGTVHILPPELQWYDGNIANALNASDSIVTEIDGSPEAEAETQRVALSKGMLPAGGNLRGLMNDEQKAIYESGLRKLNLPSNAFDQFKPWMAGITLAVLPLFQEGYSPNSGVEKVLLDKAEGKEKLALETVDFQLSLFDDLPQESQMAFLLETAGQVDQIAPQLDAMVAEWMEGDADGLAVLLNAGLTDPLIAEKLLYMRNANWAEWIDNRMDQPGTVFIAVGAGHLAGEKSVQDYLAERDIETARVQ